MANRDVELLAIGAGPSNLALAVALEELAPSLARDSLVIDRNLEISWQSSMLMPEVLSNTTFLKDLVTMRNPRSKFLAGVVQAGPNGGHRNALERRNLFAAITLDLEQHELVDVSCPDLQFLRHTLTRDSQLALTSLMHRDLHIVGIAQINFAQIVRILRSTRVEIADQLHVQLHARSAGRERLSRIHSHHNRKRILLLAGDRQLHQRAARIDQRNTRAEARERNRRALMVVGVAPDRAYASAWRSP